MQKYVYEVDYLLIVFAMNLCIHQGIDFSNCVTVVQKKGKFIDKNCSKFLCHCNVHKCL